MTEERYVLSDKGRSTLNNWGGARPGAGRPAQQVKLSREEAALLLRGLNSFKRDSPLGQLAARLRTFVDSA
jgi:hypothetical protein